MDRIAQAESAGRASPVPVRRGGAMNGDVMQLISRLESLISAGKKVPFSPVVMVDEQACLDIIDQLRVAVPEELRQARRVMHEKEQVLDRAHKEADKIMQAASVEASKMIDESELVREAQDRASQILADAEARARELRRGAETYVLDTFVGLDEELSRLLAQIKRGRAMLERPRDGSQPFRAEQEPVDPDDEDGQG